MSGEIFEFSSLSDAGAAQGYMDGSNTKNVLSCRDDEVTGVNVRTSSLTQKASLCYHGETYTVQRHAL